MSPLHPGDKEIGKALGRVPSGVFILTAEHDGTSAAMMASWVQQASFEPPTVSVAIAKGRPIGSVVQQSKRFALSIVGAKDTAIMRKYARGVFSSDQGDPFEGVNVTRTGAGAPPVLSDALAYLECRLTQVIDVGGDHELYVGQITGGKLLREGDPFTHIRGSGFHY